MNEREKANKFLRENAGKIDKTFRPRYHFAPPVGWMNDPNGIVCFNGVTHLFYQYCPYSPRGGKMFWGHASTVDNCAYIHHEVAIAPDAEDETDCFSGGSEVFDGKIISLYTKQYAKENVWRETQGLVESLDGRNFIKRAGAVIGVEDLPSGVSKFDFRDPNPAPLGNGKYGIFVGSRTEDNNRGLILIYETTDFKTFRYLNKIESPYLGNMGECPDFFTLDGKDVLLFSACSLAPRGERFRNVSSSLYMVGEFNRGTGEFNIEHCDEIDCGHSFYAPQSCENDKGERIMFAWCDMWAWGKEYYLADHGHGYNGAFTYPRALSLKDGILYQRPASGLENYAEEISPCVKTVGKCFDMTFEISEGGKVAFCNAQDSSDGFSFGLKGGRFFCDMSALKNAARDFRFSKFDYGAGVTVRILCDVSTFELFIADGKETFSERIFIESDTLDIKLSNAECVKAYQLNFPEENFEIK